MMNSGSSATASMPLRDHDVPKARMVTAVWGETHVRHLLDVAWRTLLSPGNLPSLLQRMEASYALYTDEEGAAVILKSPQFARLQALMPVEIVSFPRSEIMENRYSGHWNLSNRAIEEARGNREIVFLVVPDMIFFDGTLARWAQHIIAGKRAIFTVGTWVLEETFLPAFHARYPSRDNEVVALSPTQGVDYILHHMHPLQAASLSDSPSHLYHLDRMSECIPGQGMISRIFSSQPLVFAPGHFDFDSNRCPTNRLCDIVMDEVCNFSLGSLLHVSEFYYGQAPFDNHRIRGLASWASENVGMSHALESRYDYVYRRSDVPCDEAPWQGASRKLDRAATSILAMQAIAQVWRFAVEQENCKWAENLIALANWRWDLHSVVRADRGFTVFLPLDDAFPDDFEKVYASLAGGTADSGLLSLMLDHVVPQRLWLQDCRIVVEAEGATPMKGPQTLRGGRIGVKPTSGGPSAGARILGAPQRVGFGVVYRVDQLLGDCNFAARRLAGPDAGREVGR